MSVSLSIIFGVVPEAISAWKPGDRAARDGDEHEREQRPGDDRPAAADELARTPASEHRVDDDDADDEQRDRADLHERAEVVARAEQQPDRQHRRDEAVGGQREDQLVSARTRSTAPNDEAASGLPRTTARSAATTPMIVASAILPLRQPVHVEAHEERERDRHADRERAPRALGQRVDDGEAEAGERDDDDEQDGDGGGRRRRPGRSRCARCRRASGRRAASRPRG